METRTTPPETSVLACSGLRTLASFTILLLGLAWCPGVAPAATLKPGSLSPHLLEAVDLGLASRSARHRVVVGLALRNREQLEAFLADVQNPTSPRYGRFLSQDEFEALYSPSIADEAAVVGHLQTNGMRVTDRFRNRLIVGAVGRAAALERAFGVEMHGVLYHGRRHYAATSEPVLPDEIARVVAGVVGLDDLEEMHAHVRTAGPIAGPQAALGSHCCSLSPNDLATLYDNSAGNAGVGQTVVIAGAFAWNDIDNENFSTQWGLPPFPAGSRQVCTGSSTAPGCQFSSTNSIEIALDAEYAHGTAPSARILNYMATSPSFADFATAYNRIVIDNPAHTVSTSWGACEASLTLATQQTDDAIFANANAIGQAWFAASGDSGSRDCSNILNVDHPANSPHVIGVGGTTPTCSSGMTASNPACGGYGSEMGWEGSGGGVSQVFARPAFQAGCGVPTGPQRLVPDVALDANTSPGNYVLKGGQWFIVGGTSGAAPQWAGLWAEVTQQLGGAGLGNPGPTLYSACGSGAYHDVTAGSNGDYAAGPGYDLVTGLGTVDVARFLGVVAPTTTTTRVPTTTTSTTSTSTVTTTRPTSTSTTSTTTTTSTSTTSTTRRTRRRPPRRAGRRARRGRAGRRTPPGAGAHPAHSPGMEPAAERRACPPRLPGEDQLRPNRRRPPGSVLIRQCSRRESDGALVTRMPR